MKKFGISYARAHLSVFCVLTAPDTIDNCCWKNVRDAKVAIAAIAVRDARRPWSV